MFLSKKLSNILQKLATVNSFVTLALLSSSYLFAILVPMALDVVCNIWVT